MFDKSKAGFILFVLVVLTIVIGGYFLMNFALEYEYISKTNSESITEIINYKIDKDKDFIYFENVEYLVTGSIITNKDIVINLTGFEYLSSMLNTQEDELMDLTVYESEVNLSSSSNLSNNVEGIYSIVYREYNIIEYDKYISIIIEDFEYTIEDEVNLKNLDIYIINKEENKLITEEEILEIYEKNIEDITLYVKDVVETKSYSDGNIQVNNTINNLNYIIYPNKVGSLEIMYKVISTNNNYYDKLVIN